MTLPRLVHSSFTTRLWLIQNSTEATRQRLIRDSSATQPKLTGKFLLTCFCQCNCAIQIVPSQVIWLVLRRIDLAFYFNFESNRVYGAHCWRLFAQLLLKKNHLMILYTIIFPFCHMNNDLTCDRRYIKYDVRTFYIHILYLLNYIFIICIRLSFYSYACHTK